MFLLTCALALLDCSPLPAVEPPGLLTAIANSPGVGSPCRRDCVLMLFRRHVRPGMRLSHLARVLNAPTWLRADEVCDWTNVAGSFFIPVDITQGDTTFSIRLFPELGPGMGVIYLRVSDKVSRDELVRVLAGGGPGAAVRSTILQVSVDMPAKALQSGHPGLGASPPLPPAPAIPTSQPDRR
jgi:hypothetical protein